MTGAKAPRGEQKLLLTKLEAIAMLAARDGRDGDDERAAKDRARKRIDNAIKHGSLSFDVNGKVPLEDFVAWARTKRNLAPLFADFPTLPKDMSLAATIAVRNRASGTFSPSSLEECRRALGEAQEQVRQQAAQIRTQEVELAQLRPLAVADQKRREDMSAAGKKSGQARRNRGSQR